MNRIKNIIRAALAFLCSTNNAITAALRWGVVVGVAAFTAGCATTPSNTTPATPAQTWAALRESLTASEKATIVLHTGDVIGDADLHTAADGILAAREALYATAQANNAETLAKVLVAAKAAWIVGQAAWIVAHANEITPEQAEQYAAEGLVEDKVFDAYVASVAP